MTNSPLLKCPRGGIWQPDSINVEKSPRKKFHFLLHIIYCTEFLVPMRKGVFSKLQSDETQTEYSAFTATNLHPNLISHPRKWFITAQCAECHWWMWSQEQQTILYVWPHPTMMLGVTVLFFHLPVKSSIIIFTPRKLKKHIEIGRDGQGINIILK